ncbi:chromate resistance protein ChrB domain-containing protein [Marinobacterium aestuariivivens]|uniref:Chromate resistance protein ChrB domain-containing protein n=1 Tax=Marinobacterium aestuariivivens TaxID=1698799 RepID=A0ABW2A1L2_9GAMM
MSTLNRTTLLSLSAATCVVLLISTILAVGCKPADSAPKTVFVTRYGLGPDKWASAWLLKRHVDTNAEIRAVAPEAPLPPGVSFDTKGAVYQRQTDKTTFEVIREQHKLDDPIIRDLADLVHAIEVNFWSSPSNPTASVVEQGFRRLQQTYGRDQVTPECYMAYFDRVYQYLADYHHSDALPQPARLEVECTSQLDVTAAQPNLVREMPIAALLAELDRGKTVIFIDVREPEEFSEGHIPGAVNLTLRDAAPGIEKQLAGADYVVSYCVKDFRGFEMARTLAELGVRNSVILNPYGISGWVANGLPVAGAKSMTETEASERLADCAQDPDRCLTP